MPPWARPTSSGARPGNPGSPTPATPRRWPGHWTFPALLHVHRGALAARPVTPCGGAPACSWPEQRPRFRGWCTRCRGNRRAWRAHRCRPLPLAFTLHAASHAVQANEHRRRPSGQSAAARRQRAPRLGRSSMVPGPKSGRPAWRRRAPPCQRVGTPAAGSHHPVKTAAGCKRPSPHRSPQQLLSGDHSHDRARDRARTTTAPPPAPRACLRHAHIHVRATRPRPRLG